jgi:hypothetical protein
MEELSIAVADQLRSPVRLLLDRVESFSPAERMSSISSVRRELSSQLRNAYLRENPLADVLKLLQYRVGGLIVSFEKDLESGKDFVAEIKGEDKEAFLQEGLAPSQVEAVVESAGRFDDKHKIPAGMRALEKKCGHSMRDLFKGRIQSHFQDFYGISCAPPNRGYVQPMVEELIRFIMSDPETVLVKYKHIEIFNSLGQGVKIVRNPGEGEEVFKGFLDSAFYVSPKTVIKNERKKASPA